MAEPSFQTADLPGIRQTCCAKLLIIDESGYGFELPGMTEARVLSRDEHPVVLSNHLRGELQPLGDGST